MSLDAEARVQVQEVLKRFNDLVVMKDMQVLAEFAPGDNLLLVGSDAGEIAAGRQAIEAFFARIFSRDMTFSWEWDSMYVSHSGDLAWFFAEGWVVLTSTVARRRTPYRVSGVLQLHNGRWLWKQYHGSEPVPSE